MSRFLRILKSIVVGPAVSPPSDFKPALCSLYRELSTVWKDDSLGLIRILSFIFFFLQFINPFMWLSHLADTASPISGKIFVDVFVCGKLVFPIVLLTSSLRGNLWMNILCAYIILDTLVYLYGIVLFPSRFDKPLSPNRSLLFIIVGYAAVTMSFSWLYYSLDLIPKADRPIVAVYFSFVTSSTLGFGDMIPCEENGYRLVVVQIISSLSFLAVFLAYFISKMNSASKSK